MEQAVRHVNGIQARDNILESLVYKTHLKTQIWRSCQYRENKSFQGRFLEHSSFRIWEDNDRLIQEKKQEKVMNLEVHQGCDIKRKYI